MSRVVMVFTGGTISTLPDAAAGGNTPVLRGADILARAPGVAAIAQVEPIDWGLVPASHLRFAQMMEIARVVDEALAKPEVAGAVVVQGTDTIEETSFAYELLVRSDKPVIVTGAMRDGSSPDFDGPQNLADAAVCA
ncbi:MAG: asparaginase domain-containing protein, partial [Candidatus Limnocylindrales bacterium]